MGKIFLMLVFHFLTYSPYSLASLTEKDFWDFDRKSYNKLQDPYEASTLLNSTPKFEEFLERASALIKDTDSYKHLGFRLLHKHFELDEGEINIESSAEFDSKPSLLTFPQIIEGREATPASWMISNDGTLSAFEFTRDEKVRIALQQMSLSSEVMLGVIALIREYNLNNVIGPAILMEDLYRKDGEKLIEWTYITGRERLSVVSSRVPETDGGSRLIQTTWGPLSRSCTTYCAGETFCFYGGDCSHTQVYKHSSKHWWG